jgi:hypothetical protein
MHIYSFTCPTYPSLSARVAQSHNCPLGVKITIELENKTTTLETMASA